MSPETLSPNGHARGEVTEHRPMFEQMPGAATRQQDVVMFRVPIDDEMGVGCQDHLIEFGIHHALADQARQSVADIGSGFRQ